MALWRRVLGWVGLFFLTAVLTIGCGLGSNDATQDNPSDPATVADCRRVNHNFGETEICGQPENAVVFGMHTLGLLLSLEVQPVGLAMDADVVGGDVFDDPARQIPYLGDRLTTQPANLGNGSEPSLEKLTAIAPDLILGNRLNEGNYDLLSQIAPTLLMGDPLVKGQWQKNLRAIAVALGAEEKAEAVIAQQAARIAESRADLADAVKAHPKLLVLGATRLEEGIFIINTNSYLGELLEGVGFELIVPPAADANPGVPISLETLPELNGADSIILLGFNRDLSELNAENLDKSVDQPIHDLLETHQLQTIKASWEKNAIAQNLTASQESRVYFATYARWSLLNNPIGADLVLEQLHQFFAID
ncbi:MAG: iron-siderophore ABC transporter substrate-binding protein [Cyanobacteria bacterium J06635_15]